MKHYCLIVYQSFATVTASRKLVTTLVLLFVASLANSAAGSTSEHQPVICLKAGETADRLCALASEMAASCPSDSMAWLELSCINPASQNLVPQLIQQKSNPNLIALEREIFQKHTTSDIAESIVYRSSNLYDGKDISYQSYNLHQNSSIFVQFNSKIFNLIIANGFLNQFQTGKANGNFDLEGRIYTEEVLSHVKLPRDSDIQNVVNELRPKYGYLMIEKPLHGVASNDINFMYGNSFAKIKDIVKRRTTFSNSDSYNARFGQVPFLNRSDYRKGTFYNLSENFKMNRGNSSYYEAQIWGPLKISDVEFVAVDCFDYPSHSIAGYEIIQALEASSLSIPVYKCVLDRSGGQLQIKKGLQLYPKP